MGGSIGRFRVFLCHTLETCYITSHCETFSPGSLVFNSTGTILQQECNTYVAVNGVDIWGTGGDDNYIAGSETQQRYQNETTFNFQRQLLQW